MQIDAKEVDQTDVETVEMVIGPIIIGHPEFVVVESEIEIVLMVA